MAKDGFEDLLERIRQQRCPEYGTLSWDGQKREVAVLVQFDTGGPEQETRDRALRYLESLSQAERDALNIEVHTRAGVPVRASLRGKTGDLPPDRLVGISFRSPPGSVSPKNGVDKR